MPNVLPILRGTSSNYRAQVLYPFTRSVNFVTTVNTFLDGNEQRWPNTPPLNSFTCPMSSLLTADKNSWSAFFGTQKGRFNNDLSLTLSSGVTYGDMTLSSDVLYQTNKEAQLYDQQIEIRQIKNTAWTPPAVGTAFPTFNFSAHSATGAVQQPFVQGLQYLNDVGDNQYGPQYSWAWYGNGISGFPANLKRWKIEYGLLGSNDVTILEDFFVSVQGRAFPFSFYDPISATTYGTTRFDMDSLQIRYLTKNQCSASVSICQVLS